jgi:hypothetical protein
MIGLYGAAPSITEVLFLGGKLCIIGSWLGAFRTV